MIFCDKNQWYKATTFRPAIGNHLRDQYNMSPNEFARNFIILSKCQNKLDCLFFFCKCFLSKNWNQLWTNGVISSALNYLFRSVSVSLIIIIIIIVIYYIHLEITGDPCNLIGSERCDLFTNRTILCSKSHLFFNQWESST